MKNEVKRKGNTVIVKCPLLKAGMRMEYHTDELCGEYFKCRYFAPGKSGESGKCNIGKELQPKTSILVRPLGCRLDKDPYWKNRPNKACRVTKCPFFETIFCEISQQPIRDREAFPTDMNVMCPSPKPTLFKH